MHLNKDFLRKLFFNHYYTDIPVAQLSQRMQADLRSWAERGYQVSSSAIRFIVAWRPKDAPKQEEEHAVLLLDLALKKEIQKEE